MSIGFDYTSEPASRALARECAQRGAEMLDERRPGWSERVDAAKLDMISACDCVLGQLGGDYIRSNMADKENEDHGFTGPSCGYSDMGNGKYRYWRLLTEAWREEIKRRKEEV